MKKPHVRSSRVFRKERELSLFPDSVASVLSSDCPSVQIRKLLDSLELRDIRELYQTQGGIAYDPKSLLGVLLLGYALNVYSSRQMEDRCKYDLRFMHVAGFQTPDYRTLARFRRRIEPVLEKVFTQVLSKCIEAGLAPLKLGALDGTKLAANSSQLRKFLGKESDEEVSDPEAKVMKDSRGYLRGYNAQALVDTENGVVLAVDVSTSSNDFEQMEPTLEKAKEAGALPEEIVLDAGYDSGENHAIAEDLGTEAFIATKEDNPLFWTAVSETEVVCPMGEPLVKEATFIGTSGKPVDRYAVKGCPSCIFVKECCGPSKSRTLRVASGVSPVLRVLNAHHLRSPQARAAMRLRSATIEPFFGHLKHNKRFRQFHLRGLAGARLEMLLLATSRNLEILRNLLLDLLLRIFFPVQAPQQLQNLLLAHF